MFENTDVIQIDLSTVSKFYRRSDIWVVYFFNPKIKKCQDFKTEFVTLAEKFYGIISVAAIDCLIEEELCEEFGVFDIPQIMIFSEKLSDDGERYTDKYEWQTIGNAAAKKMQNFVSIVTAENFDTFLGREPTKHHVLLFTDKKSTPVIYKALSKRFLDKLVFGEVRASDKDLLANFGISEFPSLVVLTDTHGHATVKYIGDNKVD